MDNIQLLNQDVEPVPVPSPTNYDPSELQLLSRLFLYMNFEKCTNISHIQECLIKGLL